MLLLKKLLSVRLFTILTISYGLFLFFGGMKLYAEQTPSTQKFATLKSSEVNVRVGPNRRHPVEWVYKRKNYPVEILQEFGQWRKIRDMEGEGGWVHESLISLRRSLIIRKALTPIYKEARTTSAVLAHAEEQAILTLLQCKNSWCQVKWGRLKGWLESDSAWGIYPSEKKVSPVP